MPDQKIDVENPLRPQGEVTHWRSCCFLIDKAMALFLAQLFIRIFVLCFCVIRLLNPDLPEGARQCWTATLTFILEAWMNPPRISK